MDLLDMLFSPLVPGQPIVLAVCIGLAVLWVSALALRLWRGDQRTPDAAILAVLEQKTGDTTPPECAPILKALEDALVRLA